MTDFIIQCDMCNAELMVNPSDLVIIVKAWHKGTGDGITVKQVTDICMLVYGSNVERVLFLMLKRGELEITGMEKGQPLLRMAKKDVKPDAKPDAKPVEVSQSVTAPKPAPKPIPPPPKPSLKPTSSAPKQKLTRKRYDWKLGEQLWNDGKTKEEIAEVLGCAVITVKKRAHGRWKRREKPRTQTPVRKKKPEPKPVQSKLEGQSVGKKALVRREPRDFVLCPACLKNTTTFPCELCESTDPKLHARILSPSRSPVLG